MSFFSDKQIKDWAQRYNELGYPYEPYKRIVWDNIYPSNRFAILGAWKTGCLRYSNNSNYLQVNFEDNIYYYTNRWANNTPVGKSSWEALDRGEFREDLLKVKKISGFEEPRVFQNLLSMKGLGFVYSAFILHAINPSIFPLYDQHVFRAYYHHKIRKSDYPIAAPNSWRAYNDYTTWFVEQVNHCSNFHPTLIDKALWSFGKSLKPRR